MNPRPYIRYFLSYFRRLREYRGNLAASFVSAGLAFTLEWFVWKTMFATAGRDIGGYDADAILRYLIVVKLASFLLAFKVSEQIEKDVVSGDLAAYLARPVRYLGTLYATFLGHWTFVALVSALPMLILFNMVIGVDFAASRWIQFGILAFCGAAVFFLFESCLGAASFFLDRIYGLRSLLVTTLTLASGRMIPLDLFPDSVERLTLLSPMRAFYYGPASLFQDASFSSVLVLQLIWIAALGSTLYVLWGRGLLTFEANG